MKKMVLLAFSLICMAVMVGCSANPTAINAAPTTVPSASATLSPSPMPMETPQPTPEVTTPAPTLPPPDPTPTVDPQTVIVFEDKEMDRLIHKALGLSDQDITKGMLDTVTSVMITGKYISVKTGDERKGDDVTSLTKFDLEYEVNGKWSKELGELKTLNDLPMFENLVSLEIWYQDGMDISALPKIRKLQNLKLSNCNITDISVLSQMEAMLWTLDLTNNPIKDYAPLDALHFTKMDKDKWTMK